MKRFISRAVAAVLLLGAAACGTSGGTTEDGKTRVVASFYPMVWLAQRVGGDKASVASLTKPGAEPHDLELTPRQVIEVGQAKLVVYIKGVQPAVDEAVDQHAAEHALNAAALVKTLAATPGGEVKTSFDPHLWLDPSRLATVATALGDRLAKADPRNAATYKANAATVVTDLTRLDQDLTAGLQTCRLKTIVTSHAAFGYFAERYGLQQLSIAGIDPEAEPSPKRLAELSQQVRQAHATTVFTETLVSPKVAQTLATEAGVRTATLDPVEGLPAGSHDDYLSVMRRNLETLRRALECT